MTCKDCAFASQKSAFMRCRNHGIDTMENAVICNEFKHRTQTNGDRVRTMTDEELAEHLYRWDNSPLHASLERWLDWLKEEATSETLEI